MQMHTKLLDILEKVLTGKYDPVAAILECENSRAFTIIRPGGAPWFRAMDWRADSVASIDGKRVRLVLLDAFESNKGALTRTLAGIVEAGLRPAIVDPTRELAATLTRRGWKMRVEGTRFEDREDVWVQTKQRVSRRTAVNKIKRRQSLLELKPNGKGN